MNYLSNLMTYLYGDVSDKEKTAVDLLIDYPDVCETDGSRSDVPNTPLEDAEIQLKEDWDAAQNKKESDGHCE